MAAFGDDFRIVEGAGDCATQRQDHNEAQGDVQGLSAVDELRFRDGKGPIFRAAAGCGGIDTLTSQRRSDGVEAAMKPISYRRQRVPPDFIHHAVWLHFRFTLNFRDVAIGLRLVH
jgi:hypothetical protein